MSLKCVIAWSNDRRLSDAVEETLTGLALPRDIRRLGADTFVVSSDHAATDLRDFILEAVHAREGLLVIDFETWSGYGEALDAEWLLRRGH